MSQAELGVARDESVWRPRLRRRKTVGAIFVGSVEAR